MVPDLIRYELPRIPSRRCASLRFPILVIFGHHPMTEFRLFDSREVPFKRVNFPKSIQKERVIKLKYFQKYHLAYHLRFG